jgi:hypothetical protein
MALDAGENRFAARRKKQRTPVIVVLLLCVLVAVGCGVGGTLAIRHGKMRQGCYENNGGGECRRGV